MNEVYWTNNTTLIEKYRVVFRWCLDGFFISSFINHSTSTTFFEASQVPFPPCERIGSFRSWVFSSSPCVFVEAFHCENGCRHDCSQQDRWGERRGSKKEVKKMKADSEYSYAVCFHISFYRMLVKKKKKGLKMNWHVKLHTAPPSPPLYRKEK